MKACKDCGCEIKGKRANARYCIECNRLRKCRYASKHRNTAAGGHAVDKVGRQLRYQIENKTGVWYHIGDKPGDDWELDHIIPLSNADGWDEYIEELNHPLNIRWLKREDNQKRRGWKSTIEQRTDFTLLCAIHDNTLDSYFSEADRWDAAGTQDNIDAYLDSLA